MKIQIISGEQIQELCDCYIGTEYDFSFNPRISSQKDKQIYLDDLCNDLSGFKYIFCYTHLFQTHFKRIYEILKTIRNPFILVCHNSDGCFQKKYEQLFNLSCLNCIFTQNNMTRHDRIFHLPIGIGNSQWEHGNIGLLMEMRQNISKDRFIFFNFNIETNRDKRLVCYNEIEKKGIQFLNRFSNQREYLQELSKYQFAICPEGHGPDCHRIYECLYLNVIPIMVRSHLTDYLSQHLQIIVLERWSELDIDKCIYNPEIFKSMEMLSMEKIKSDIHNMVHK